MAPYGTLLGFSFCTGVPGFPAHLDRLMRSLNMPTLPEYSFYQQETAPGPELFYVEVRVRKRFGIDGTGSWRFGAQGSSTGEAVQSAAYCTLSRLSYEIGFSSSSFRYYPSRRFDDDRSSHTSTVPEDSPCCLETLRLLTTLDTAYRAATYRLRQTEQRLRDAITLLQPVTRSECTIGYALLRQRSPTPPECWRFPDVEPTFRPTPSEASPPRPSRLEVSSRRLAHLGPAVFPVGSVSYERLLRSIERGEDESLGYEIPY
jgi:hypothetical protein